jgi:Undecaprenyl-phosphate glucose phosphotransferase
MREATVGVPAGPGTKAKLRSEIFSEPIFTELIKAADLSLVIAAAFSAYLLYTPLTHEMLAGGGKRYIVPTLLASFFFVFLVNYIGGYELKRLKQPQWQVPRIMGIWFLVIASFIIEAFATKTSEVYSRLWTLLWTILVLGLLASQRGFLYLMLNSHAAGFFKRSIVIVGGGDALDQTVAKLRAHPDDVSICAVFSDTRFPGAPGKNGVSVSGGIDDLVKFVKHEQVDAVIVAVPLGANSRIRTIIEKLKQVSVDVLISVELVGEKLSIQGFRRICDLAALEIINRPLRDWDAVIKWIEDKVLAVAMLVITGPLMLLIAALIKLDSPGPVLFAQERYGFNNKVIKVLKFRTMYVDAEDRSGAQRTVPDDPRVIRVGRLLRALSLDELPQLFNVLKGEMSFVGPRPHAVAMRVEDFLYHDAVAAYAERHRVKPGITGWAQINGLRGEVNSLEKGAARVDYDLYYIERWSLWLDLKILALTIPAALSRQNAF